MNFMTLLRNNLSRSRRNTSIWAQASSRTRLCATCCLPFKRRCSSFSSPSGMEAVVVS